MLFFTQFSLKLNAISIKGWEYQYTKSTKSIMHLLCTHCVLTMHTNMLIFLCFPGNFLTCTICEAVMTALDEQIVDPANEQVWWKD